VLGYTYAQDESIKGVKGDVKLKKWEEKVRMKNWTYHVHKESDL
jgi:hypothetical protein